MQKDTALERLERLDEIAGAVRRYTEAHRVLLEAEAEMLLGMARALVDRPAVEVERTRSPEWMTVKQAAEHIGLSSRETYRRIAIREIPAYSLGPQSIRVNRHELDAWLEANPYE